MSRERHLDALVVAYVALLVGPLVPLAVEGPTWPLFAVGILLGATVGFVAADATSDLAASLGNLQAGLLLVAVPVAYVWPLVTRPPGLDPLAFFVHPAGAGLLAVLVGFLAVVVAYEHLRRREREDVTVLVEFAARPSPRRRKILVVASLLPLSVAMVVFGALYLWADSVPGSTTVFVTVSGALSAILPAQAEREVALGDEGVVLQGRVLDWSSFDGAEFTDRALVLHRSEWFQGKQAFDREDVENEDEVRATLDRYLDYSSPDS
ncbi:hypothetical protein [Halomicrococcus gelatinilyticus]|uniref:hypothetical protein n=1 Tax=Halomicrococcus gelatinilyticus TaxID=1702103 RepID=UPI002E11FA1D